MQITWTKLANKDLEIVEEYITEESGSASTAIDVILKIINTIELVLLQYPYAGRLGLVKTTRELVIKGLPYIAVYRVVENLKQIQILRVMHDVQEWLPTSDIE